MNDISLYTVFSAIADNLFLQALIVLSVAMIFIMRFKSRADTWRVVDGDGIILKGKNCRLYGLDAPEMSQASGGCALKLLKELLEDSREKYGYIKYRKTGLCRWGRPVVILYSGDGTDINGELVRLGYARAYLRYSYRYLFKEMSARFNRRGLWADGYFVHPEKVRHGKA